MLDHELAFVIIHFNVKLDLYIIDGSLKSVKNMTMNLNRFENDIEMRYARFHIVTLLLAKVKKSVDTSAVLMCESSQMTNDTRLTSVKAVAEKYDELGYYEEFFGW